MRWEQTPNNSGNGSKTRRSSCNLLLLPKESGAQGQAEIQQGAAPVEEQAPAPGRAQGAVRKVPAPAGGRGGGLGGGVVPGPGLGSATGGGGGGLPTGRGSGRPRNRRRSG